MDSNLLHDYWKKSGKTKTHLSKTLCVSRPTLERIFATPANTSYSVAKILQKEFSIPDYDMDLIFLP